MACIRYVVEAAGRLRVLRRHMLFTVNAFGPVPNLDAFQYCSIGYYAGSYISTDGSIIK